MSIEFYVRYVGAYEGRDEEIERRLERVGLKRLSSKDGDQFWLSSPFMAKDELAKEVDKCKSEKAKKDAILSWLMHYAHAGQIAMVEEMWGAGPG